MKKFLLISVVVVVGVVIVYMLIRPEAPEPRIVIADSATTRSTATGDVVGFIDHYDANAWLGIPFAQPPVGDLRWKAPVAATPWEGTRAALDIGSACTQIGNVLSGAKPEAYGAPDGSEDCLYLNVWAPAILSEVPTGNDRLPVMFWIHGGGNSIGHAGSASYSGAHLATRHNVVLVSANYRLGPFGWFAHPALRENASAADDSGNYGTLDNILALQWVQDNIGKFGGDPGNVMIFGESAGARDVLTLMASPLAAGLYHRAVVQSGGYGVSDLANAENYSDDEVPGHESSSREVINRILIKGGLAADRDAAKTFQDQMSLAEVAAYLRGKSAAEILGGYEESTGSMLNMPQIFGDGHVLPKGETNSSLFLDTANYNVTPIILGTNRDEAKLFMMMGGDAVNSIMGIPWSFKDEAAYERDNRYSTDAWKVRGVDDLAAILRETQGDSVFAYRFDWDEERSVFGFDLGKALGAAHGFEINFVFGNFGSTFGLNLYDDESIPFRDRLSDSMMSYWAEFAYSGSPGKGRDGNQVEWKSWENGDDSTERLMVLDTDRDQGIRMISDRLHIDDIKARFKADPSYATQKEYCEAYKLFFRGDAFDQDEYSNLGSEGC
jgi:para-nitrobenzyl esterase